MIRTLVFVLLLIIVFLLAAVFAYLNPGVVSLNLAVGEFEIPKAQAFAITIAVGWVLGALSATVLVLKLMRDRAKLRREVRLAEAEADNLRSLPLRDGT
ncbi:MAG: LapA family protein [Gammaproteobacteria bacterium]|nr:LapA family protein [Gammaproteobacteria bacterium]NND60267.1 LapA family protein [Gammaproteobacteria bacterium]